LTGTLKALQVEFLNSNCITKPTLVPLVFIA
jgi:hypothetical protein